MPGERAASDRAGRVTRSAIDAVGGTARPAGCRFFSLLGSEQRRSKHRIQCWLGREDSNLRMAEPKSAALPLGYAPRCNAPNTRNAKGRQAADGVGSRSSGLITVGGVLTATCARPTRSCRAWHVRAGRGSRGRRCHSREDGSRRECRSECGRPIVSRAPSRVAACRN